MWTSMIYRFSHGQDDIYVEGRHDSKLPFFSIQNPFQPMSKEPLRLSRSSLPKRGPSPQVITALKPSFL